MEVFYYSSPRAKELNILDIMHISTIDGEWLRYFYSSYPEGIILDVRMV